MDVSVLVVGNERFLTTWVSQIRNIVSGAVEVSSDLDEVISLIQSKQFEILILQAALLRDLALCHPSKKQSQLSWTYCILIDDQSSQTDEGLEQNSCRELVACAEALENGADAYLRMTLVGTRNSAIAFAQERLLKAQIQAGLRGVQFYRSLMQTNDVLSTMALADPLTQLSNRRAMEWDLPRQTQHAHAHSKPLSLIILDVDYFKSVNDNYGHQIGDRVLQMLAARLQNNLRVQDSLFRYGGEEFVIVLSQTNFQDARVVAKRMRSLVSDQPFNIDGTLSLEITISLGLASLLPTDDLTGESLLRRADHNLLRAKSSGRNQVFCGEENR